MKDFVYVGTYTGGSLSDHRDTQSKGIYCFACSPGYDKLTFRGTYGKNEIDPGFLIIKDGFLFAENERRDMGTVRSFSIAADGALTLCSVMETEGSKCAFLSAHPSGKYIFATNYASGSLMIISCDDTGKLSLTDKVQHYGKSVVPVRQDAPRAHSVRLTPDGKGLLVPDLGIDKIMNYQFDEQKGLVQPNSLQPYVMVDPGEGPRHLVFHPNGKYVYLDTEIGNHVYVYAYDNTNQTIRQIQKIALLPDDYTGKSYSAEILISSDGRFVYVCNRGHDTITCYQVDVDTGLLSHEGWFPSGGKGPRHIIFTPDEKYLYCANKDGDLVTILERDRQTGSLGEVIGAYEVPAPSALAWYGRK